MQHIEEHREMIGQSMAIRNTIESPNVIYQSKSYPDRDVYFKLGAINLYPNYYVKVAVDHGSEATRDDQRA